MKSEIEVHQKVERKNYIIKTHKKGITYKKPHLFILNKGLNSGKPSKEEIVNSYIVIFENKEDCDNIYHITEMLWKSKFWHRNLYGSVIPFLRIGDFIKEFSKKVDEMLNDFEQHQKDMAALKILVSKEEQFKENIVLINDLKRAILYRYCKK